MCESSVYLESDSERTLVMAEAAKILFEGEKVICVNTFGERTELEGVEIAVANLIKHEIVLRRRKG